MTPGDASGRRRDPWHALTRETPPAAAAELLAPGDTVLVKGSRGVGLAASARRCALDARGAASARRGAADGCGDPRRRHRRPADLHLPRAEVHRVPAPARVRPAHPRGRARRATSSKAGTPTMGGVIIFIAVSVPFLILTDWRLARRSACSARRSPAPLLGFADDYTKIVKRRSLGLRARTKLVVDDRDLARAVVGRPPQGAGSRRRVELRYVDYHVDLGPFYPVLIYLVVAGTTSARQPDRRPRRARRRLRRDRAAGLCRDHLPERHGTPQHLDLALLAACLVGACVGFLWFNAFPATIFMGDTGSLGLGGAIAGLAVMTQDRDAADPDRRHLRDRGALGR